ncbi:MJ0570-related domain protein [Gregarina niphandrodes]|uniref:Diphthine--ammonia ligase n=1 Tax=Gregarina niphandrodes TaxID=110365 RepID=A0A023B0U7_GRENI|nr:MJ0570-related domain protein [Gregarina niphandrodes]EZG46012.1 MJ0570-related domain protein [Gregarina niphandrodes]|eukprot:XP_011132386.1 MJ0570-related domain protein [Gregarina niphandrodes]
MSTNALAPRRRAIALISGGKDSILAAHLAQVVLGYEVAAFAHLKPKQASGTAKTDETDSYMFQSVGSDAVDYLGEHALTSPASASPLGRPVVYFSAEIQGESLRVGVDYEPEEGDEVEDMRRLLQQVLTQLKRDDAETPRPVEYAVVTGAIWSRYQRHRVESVCRDLGMRSVSPLWSLDQNLYLLQLRRLRREFECILIKTACLGLGRRHLLRSFDDEELVRDLMCLYDKYEINVGGEGGEYETFTTRAPGYGRGGLALDPQATKRIQADFDTSYARVRVEPRCPIAPAAFGILAAESSYLSKVRALWNSGQLELIEAGFAAEGPGVEMDGGVTEVCEVEDPAKAEDPAKPWLALRKIRVPKCVDSEPRAKFQQFGKQGRNCQQVSKELIESDCMAFRLSSEEGMVWRRDVSVAVCDVLPSVCAPMSVYGQVLSALRGLDNFLAATGDQPYNIRATPSGPWAPGGEWSVAGLIDRLVVGLPRLCVDVVKSDVAEWVRQLCVEYARRNPGRDVRRLNLFLRLKALDLVACPLCLEHGALCQCPQEELLQHKFLRANPKREVGPREIGPSGVLGPEKTAVPQRITILFDQPTFYVNFLVHYSNSKLGSIEELCSTKLNVSEPCNELGIFYANSDISRQEESTVTKYAPGYGVLSVRWISYACQWMPSCVVLWFDWTSVGRRSSGSFSESVAADEETVTKSRLCQTSIERVHKELHSHYQNAAPIMPVILLSSDLDENARRSICKLIESSVAPVKSRNDYTSVFVIFHQQLTSATRLTESD